MNEHIAPEFEFRWLENDSILLVRVNNLSNSDIVKRYYDVMDEYIRTWPEGKPYLVLFDSSQAAAAGWTSYMRQRSEQAHGLIPVHAEGRTASVSQASLVLRFVKGFVELNLNRKNRRVETRIFYEYDEALNWLKDSQKEPAK